jgi:hypothetical protein
MNGRMTIHLLNLALSLLLLEERGLRRCVFVR